MIDINKELLKDCKPELEALFLDQYKENEDGQWGLDPDYVTYFTLEELGVLHIYVARVGGKPVGYLIVMVNEHLHHKGIRYAVSDIFYVTPEYRRSMVAAELIRFAEEDLKQLDVKRLVIAMKIKQQFRKLLSGLDFDPIEELWEKSI